MFRDSTSMSSEIFCCGMKKYFCWMIIQLPLSVIIYLMHPCIWILFSGLTIWPLNFDSNITIWRWMYNSYAALKKIITKMTKLEFFTISDILSQTRSQKKKLIQHTICNALILNSMKHKKWFLRFIYLIVYTTSTNVPRKT